MEIKEARFILERLLKVIEPAFDILGTDFINMGLERNEMEAIKVLMAATDDDSDNHIPRID